MAQMFADLHKFDSQEFGRQMDELISSICPINPQIVFDTSFEGYCMKDYLTEDSHGSHCDSEESHTQSMEQQDSLPHCRPSKPKRRTEDVPTKRSPQQTKNFLQNFKHHHINYLSTKLAVDLNSYKIIRDLRDKSGINRHDYQLLYQEPDFQEAFKEMFESEYLQDMLRQSKCKDETRRIHLQNLFVLERAFRNKEFPKIKMYCQNFH